MRIICLLGKSGSGKSTVEAGLEKLGYHRIISYTTRQIRGKEQNGIDYYYVDKKQYQKIINNDMLMEHAEYNGNFYGAPRPVGSINNVIVVETSGFESIKRIYGDQAIGVYIDTPDDVIAQRLNKRNDTSESEASNRKIEDERKFNAIKNKVDLVVNGNQSVDNIIIEILKYVREH